jgi:hypothetical protein
MRHLTGISAKEAKMCRFVMQSSADKVLRYMTRRGSAIRLFSIFPSLATDNPPDHSWPCYHYTKGEATDVIGRKQVSAVPLTRAELEMPRCQSLVLFHSARWC